MSLKPSTIAAIKAHINLDDETKALIRLANWDLYYGPIYPDTLENDDDRARWHGFSAACKTIRHAVSTGGLWVDTDSDCVQDSEPEWTGPCEDCEDSGCACDDEQCDGCCSACSGRGWIYTECPDHWLHLDSRDVKIALVGRELAPYV